MTQWGQMPSEVWLRQVTLPVEQAGSVIGYLQVATPMTPVQTALREFLLTLSVLVPLALGFIGLTGWVLGGLAMQPIRDSYDQLQRFTSNASHELRTPLAAVLSNAQVGLLVPLEQEQQRNHLEQIVEAAKSMSTLVSNLLLLARHSGRLAPESLKEVDLTSLLHDLANFYTTQAAEKQLSLKSDLPQHPVELEAEPDLLRQAVGICSAMPVNIHHWRFSAVAFVYPSRAGGDSSFRQWCWDSSSRFVPYF
jgi:signal transduction histidine kinase